jgi:NitT/TauT family transport system permease protein
VRAKKWLQGLGVALFWFSVWYIVAGKLNKPLLLPSPYETCRALIHLARDDHFWLSTGASVLRILSGFFFALVFGTLLGSVCSLSRLISSLLSPIKSIIKTTPVSSFIILVLLWLPVGITPAFIAFLMAVPIFWINVMEGIRKTDRQLLEMALTYKFGAVKKLRHIMIPSVLPYFSAAFSAALGFAWKAGIAAEVIARPGLSIGSNLQDAKVLLDTESLFAWTVVVILLSHFLEKVLVKGINLMISGKGENKSDMPS